MSLYRVLPAFADVAEGLRRLQGSRFRLYAFSNGAADALEVMLNNAGIRELFLGVVSVDDIKSFKPNPAVYSHCNTTIDHTSVGNQWLFHPRYRHQE